MAREIQVPPDDMKIIQLTKLEAVDVIAELSRQLANVGTGGVNLMIVRDSQERGLYRLAIMVEPEVKHG